MCFAGSFGTLDEVSKTILPGGEGVKSTLVDAYTRNKSYVYDYIVTQDGRPEKHIKVEGVGGGRLVASMSDQPLQTHFFHALSTGG